MEEKTKNPVRFCEDFNSFYLWTSFVGIKYMKHFLTAEEAFDYISDKPTKFSEFNDRNKSEWVNELNLIASGKQLSYKIVHPIVMALTMPIFFIIFDFCLSKFFVFLASLGLSNFYIGKIILKIFWGLQTFTQYLPTITAGIALVFIVLKLAEVAIYRKFIFKNNRV